MIEKITNQNQIARHKLAEKINKLIDAVNVLQAQVAILEEHAHPTAETPDYDDTDDIAEVKNENVPRPIKLYVCPDGSVYDNEDVAKSHAASIFNPLPAGATTTDRVYLEQELDRTKKQLDLALKELKQLKYGGKADRTYLKNKAGKALDQITALEQKDVK